jgi:hypothetical protein
MGLGILDDDRLQHVPGTALLADMVTAQEHQYHGALYFTSNPHSSVQSIESDPES